MKWKISKVHRRRLLKWAKETPEQTAERRRKAALASAQRRANETPERKAERRLKSQQRSRARRSRAKSKSPVCCTTSNTDHLQQEDFCEVDVREMGVMNELVPLDKRSIVSAKNDLSRYNMSTIRIKTRISEGHHRRLLRWAKETPEETEERRKKAALASALRRANETPEQKAERRRKNRERARMNRSCALEKSLGCCATSNPAQLQQESTKIVAIPNGSSAVINNAENTDKCFSYTCIACKSGFDNPQDFFNHIQQACLSVYLKQPEVLSKTVTLIKSKLEELRRVEQQLKNGYVMKPKNGYVMKQKCKMCGEDFSIRMVGASARSEVSYCSSCREVQQVLTASVLVDRRALQKSPQQMETRSLPSDCDDSGSPVSTSNKKNVRHDLLEGAEPPKRPLLTCETDLPVYMWPKQMDYFIKEVGLCYSKDEPYKMHHCWECDKPILPTSKRFIEHFRMLYECRWCIYTTHCHLASVDHVMRMHVNQEAMQEEHCCSQDLSTAPNSIKQELHRTISPHEERTSHPLQQDIESNFTLVKGEPPDLDESGMFQCDAVCINPDAEPNSLTIYTQSDDDAEDSELLPPVNVRCLAITCTSLLLQWDPSPHDNITGYRLIFQGSGGPSQQTLPPEHTLVRLTGLSPDTFYVIRIYTVSNDALSQCAILHRKTSKADESEYGVLDSPPVPSSSVIGSDPGFQSGTNKNGCIFENERAICSTLRSNFSQSRTVKVETISDEEYLTGLDLSHPNKNFDDKWLVP